MSTQPDTSFQIPCNTILLVNLIHQLEYEKNATSNS